MNRYAILALGLFLILPAVLVQAQAPPPQSEKPPTATIKLQVVLSRYEGEKKVSSFPYTLSLVPGRNGSLRAGAEVPVPTSTVGPDKNAVTSYTLQNVGTQVEATVTPTSDGKYNLRMQVTERSVRPTSATEQSRVPNVPTFRNMTSSSEAILSNGETIQFTASSDQVSNETFRIDVTLTVGNK